MGGEWDEAKDAALAARLDQLSSQFFVDVELNLLKTLSAAWRAERAEVSRLREPRLGDGEIAPSFSPDGLGYCDLTCPQHDGKRCRILGVRAPDSRVCPPWADRLRAELAAEQAEVSRLRGEVDRLSPLLADPDRDLLGREVRRVWVEWAKEQDNPKPSWLVEWDDLPEPDREVDRRIGETLAGPALAEVARLQAGGCARDQRLTQHCALAEEARVEAERLRSVIAEPTREELVALTSRAFAGITFGVPGWADQLVSAVLADQRRRAGGGE